MTIREHLLSKRPKLGKRAFIIDRLLAKEPPTLSFDELPEYTEASIRVSLSKVNKDLRRNAIEGYYLKLTGRKRTIRAHLLPAFWAPLEDLLLDHGSLLEPARNEAESLTEHVGEGAGKYESQIKGAITTIIQMPDAMALALCTDKALSDPIAYYKMFVDEKRLRTYRVFFQPQAGYDSQTEAAIRLHRPPNAHAMHLIKAQAGKLGPHSRACLEQGWGIVLFLAPGAAKAFVHTGGAAQMRFVEVTKPLNLHALATMFINVARHTEEANDAKVKMALNSICVPVVNHWQELEQLSQAQATRM